MQNCFKTQRKRARRPAQPGCAARAVRRDAGRRGTEETEARRPPFPVEGGCLVFKGKKRSVLRRRARPSAPLREWASSPLREFSFRFPLLYLAFFDFGYKNTALFKSGKIIKFGSDLCRTLQKTAVFVKFAFKPSAINCTRV